MSVDDMIAELEDKGFSVVRAPTPDEDLFANWHQVLCILRMAEDRASSGATLRLTPGLPQWSDETVKGLAKSSVMHMVERILERAVVVREKETVDA